MTAEVFTSVRIAPDDVFEIQNVLSIRLSTHVVNDRATALVNVDTNYKDTRPGEHPVNLSLVDAVKAASALIHATRAAYHQTDEVDALDVLRTLSNLDVEVQSLRDVLLRDMRNPTDEEN